ncbi:MAG: Fic family protein, partial [Jiangellaceae bacterium]
MTKDQPQDRGDRPDWPAVTWETYGWELPEELAVSRRQRFLHAGRYQAAVTPEIAHLEVRLPTWLLAEAEEAAAEIARFDAEVQAALGDGELAPMSAVLLRSESAASSQIENLTVGAR